MKFTIRKIHKYLSLFISLQLLLWTASGIYFAYNKIENVRGEQYREQTSFSVDLSKLNFEVEDISTLSFANRLNERVVVIRDTQGKKYFDFDGNLIDKISFEDALKVVKTKTNLSPLTVEEVTEAKKRHTPRLQRHNRHLEISASHWPSSHRKSAAVRRP